MPAVTRTTLSKKAASAIRVGIKLAGGNEVCFACTQGEDGTLETARIVSRGDIGRVLALPGFAQRGEMLVHNHPSGVLEASDADLAVAARIYEDGVGFAIVNNDASNLYVVVETPRTEPQKKIAPGTVSDDLGPDGPIAALHASFEDRPSQRALASSITALYNSGGVGLLEAGTGVGKSLGYLLPALRWSAANGERTIVSTNTINLQEQLVGKDLPFLARALTDQKVRFALLKGWRNYLCKLRLEQARGAGATLFEDGMQSELGIIAAWAERTSDGSLADLPTPPRSEVWDEVAAEPDICPRFKCQHFDACFLFRARRAAAEADVIVVNHHLLLADVAVRRASQNWDDSAVLPAYQRLVIDEGHHLEDAAAAHLGATVTRRALQRLFSRLERRGKGLIAALVQRLGATNELMSTASLDLVQERLAPAVHSARDKSTLLFDLLDTVLEEAGVPVLRLTDAFATHRVWQGGLKVALENTLGEIAVIDGALRTIRERIERVEKVDETAGPLLAEIRAVSRRLTSAGDALRATLSPPEGDESVRWIEVRGKERVVAVSMVPLDLAPILRDDLFGRVKTTVVTSATLTADERFDFLTQRLGLRDKAPVTGIFPSPFRYGEQALLAIPNDVPAPNVDAAGHMRAVTRIVLDVAEASDGGMFVLFTSHKDVRAMAAELRSRGVERRWPLLVHGDESRDVLLARFRDAGSGILLGTASFWEGVDVPGNALRALILAKLPFRVPTEPITAAQCEAIEAHGGNAFAEYMLPHAALRLKQGFGRLIRTATDRGVVVICDPRIVTKHYGRGLLDALPPARRTVGRWRALLEEVQSFYSAHLAPTAQVTRQ
ncbi:MAG: helicase c2 [Gemmatimonadetes bacterium]|nr:helicase c2 [Gemmatimonadota bacterium]